MVKGESKGVLPGFLFFLFGPKTKAKKGRKTRIWEHFAVSCFFVFLFVCLFLCLFVCLKPHLKRGQQANEICANHGTQKVKFDSIRCQVGFFSWLRKVAGFGAMFVDPFNCGCVPKHHSLNGRY